MRGRVGSDGAGAVSAQCDAIRLTGDVPARGPVQRQAGHRMVHGHEPINLTNQFLIAMPGMADETFAGAVVYLCEHTEKGALGLVINKPIDIKLRNLFEKVELTLDREDLAERAGVLRRPGADRARLRAARDACTARTAPTARRWRSPAALEMTTSKDVLEALSNGAGPRKVLVTLGYSGWGAGQLEDEIGRNGWLTVSAEPEVIFDTPIEQRYDQALSLLGIDPRMLSQEAGHA